MMPSNQPYRLLVISIAAAWEVAFRCDSSHSERLHRDFCVITPSLSGLKWFSVKTTLTVLSQRTTLHMLGIG